MTTIDADAIGHSILEPDGAALAGVAEIWPQVLADGKIDRRKLAAIVFSDREALRTLESITHPYIFDMIRGQVDHVVGPVVVEIPVINDRLGSEWRRLVVDCRDEAKIARAIARGMDEVDAVARLSVQPGRSAWLAAADLVVPNHGTEEELTATVRQLIDAL